MSDAAGIMEAMSAHDKLVGAATLKRLRLSRGRSLADTARAIIDTAARLRQPLDCSGPSPAGKADLFESLGG